MAQMRFHDWQTRLSAFLNEAQGRAFARGEFDCCLMVLDAVAVITGEDFSGSFRGRYSDAAGAQAIIDNEYQGSLAVAASAHFGQALNNVRLARRGDVVMFDTPEGDALGIVDLSGTKIAAVAPTGLVRLPLSRATMAWRV